jgi:tetratricopeptide (TPR) repeat protein
MNRLIFIFSLFLSLLLYSSCGETNKKATSKNENLDSLLAKDPNNVGLLVKRGNLMLDSFLLKYNKKFFEIAKPDATKAFRLDSSRIDTRLLYADVLANDPERTVTDVSRSQYHYSFIVKKQPKNVKALVGLSSTYAYFADFQTALQYVDQALKINPKYRDAYVMKGTIFLMQNNRKLAISSYETAVQQDPTFELAYLRLGQLYTEDEKYKIAIEKFRNAVALNPKLADAIYGVAYCDQMLERYKEAEIGYHKLMQVDGKYHLGWFNIGYIKQFHTENQLDSAIIYYQMATDIQPEFVKAWHNIGLCYEDKNDRTRALQSYAKALKYNPNFELTKERVAALK